MSNIYEALEKLEKRGVQNRIAIESGELKVGEVDAQIADLIAKLAFTLGDITEAEELNNIAKNARVLDKQADDFVRKSLSAKNN